MEAVVKVLVSMLGGDFKGISLYRHVISLYGKRKHPPYHKGGKVAYMEYKRGLSR